MQNPAVIKALLARDWHAAPGASDEALAKLESELPFAIPDEYRALLRVSDGGEGPLKTSPLRLCLYDVAFAREIWNDPFYREQYPNYFFFGSNGSGDSIAIDVRSGQAGAIVTIDCIAGEDSKEVIARDFLSFLNNVGAESVK
ncbi:MAG TPA: SMI1/KNR4 family protein [Burkholderiales bacterium]|nr:SMI1/KNR4 family protein [Burkholderiales bacterium]